MSCSAFGTVKSFGPKEQLAKSVRHYNDLHDATAAADRNSAPESVDVTTPATKSMADPVQQKNKLMTRQPFEVDKRSNKVVHMWQHLISASNAPIVGRDSQRRERLLALAHFSSARDEATMNMNMNTTSLLSAAVFCDQYEVLARQLQSLTASRQVHPLNSGARSAAPSYSGSMRRQRSEVSRETTSTSKSRQRGSVRDASPSSHITPAHHATMHMRTTRR